MTNSTCHRELFYNPEIKFKQHSITPPFLIKHKEFENIELFTLLSSEDKLQDSPTYIFGGTADGQGLIQNPNKDGYTLFVNNEDNWSISQISLDNSFKPIKGEYVLNSTGGLGRLCSATMVTPEIHGFGPIFLSANENSNESLSHGIIPFIPQDPSVPKQLPGLGRWSAENIVPLAKTAYPGKTVMLIGEDAIDSSGGQLVLYLSESAGDLTNGKIYVLRKVDGDIYERNMHVSKTYDVEFIQINNHTQLSGSQIQQSIIDNKAIRFAKVEDVDYRKGGSIFDREIYFNASGQPKSGFNDNFSRTYKGRTYKLQLNSETPLKGKLECLLDGDDPKSPAFTLFQNPDNICTTKNYLYICEDPIGYGDETHQAYLYQYDLTRKILSVVLEIKKLAKYNTAGSPLHKLGDWELSGIIDISEIINYPNTFSISVQPHGWVDAKFTNPDGGIHRIFENQGSQIVLIRGLPR